MEGMEPEHGGRDSTGRLLVALGLVRAGDAENIRLRQRAGMTSDEDLGIRATPSWLAKVPAS
jgi:hypothetical protein